jgi:succinate-semialdehyde dehydrogenase/glutarate-semialdehyde dehydrogenase
MSLNLKDPDLFRQQCLIDGAWANADSGETIAVRNPATGETLGTVPKMGAAETRRAIDAANAALPGWRAKTAGERAKLLRRWYELLLENQEDLARLMTAEQGKPLAEARGEIAYSPPASSNGSAKKPSACTAIPFPPMRADKRILTIRQPVGVVAAITPWNFPSAMLGRKLGPALAAGCTVVCKPALQTPYSALAIAALAERAGMPPGVINIVTGRDAAAIGTEMTSNPRVRKLSFTGSTLVGKRLAAQCVDGLKRVSIELGGNAPFIVFEDADLDAAVEGAIASKYRNAGQTCVCANRLLRACRRVRGVRREGSPLRSRN